MYFYSRLNENWLSLLLFCETQNGLLRIMTNKTFGVSRCLIFKKKGKGGAHPPPIVKKST